MPQKAETKEPKNIALFLLISQPPNVSEIVSVIQTIDKYDALIICFKTPMEVMPLQHVIEIWSLILNKYKGKFILTSCDTDFATVAKLAEEFHDKTILTLSKKVFVHLSTMGIHVKLVNKVRGYNDMFLRSAYIQGRALDYIMENYGKNQR